MVGGSATRNRDFTHTEKSVLLKRGLNANQMVIQMKIRNFLLASAALACFSPGLSTGASAQSAHFFAVLDGASECNAASPPLCRQGDPDGGGSAAVMIFGPTSLCAVIEVHNLANVTAAHIHRGGTTVNGAIEVALAAPVAPGAGNPGTSTFCNNAVPVATINNIRFNTRFFYVNVHTGQFPLGAVRGQLF